MPRSIFTITSINAAVLLTIYFLFFGPGNILEGKAEDDSRTTKKADLVYHPDGRVEQLDPGKSILEAKTNLSFEEVMEAVRRGEINLISELWKLRRNCGSKMSIDACDAHIMEWIASNYSGDEAARMKQLFGRYKDYEAAMRSIDKDELHQSGNSFERIKEIRREAMGEEDAALVFGYDEARADFGRNFQSFLENTAGMDSEARLAAFNEMRQEHYGDYWDTIRRKEPAFDVYEYEMQIRSDEMASLKGEAHTDKLFTVRAKYFGEDGARRMAEVDRQLSQEQELHAELSEKENALRTAAAQSGMSDNELADKIQALRVELLGEDGAAAYGRMQSYREATQQL